MSSRFSVALVILALLLLNNASPLAPEQGRVLRFTPYSKRQFLQLPATVVDTVEKHHLLTHRNRVVRRKGELIIRLDNSKNLRLANYFSDTEVERCVDYAFRGEVREMRSWLVEVRLWEGYYAVLIDQRTGQQTKLWDTPVMAPDNKHFVTCSADLETEYIPNGIQYWAIRDHRAIRLWEQQFESWAPEEARWITASSIAIRQLRLGAKVGTYQYHYVSVKLSP